MTKRQQDFVVVTGVWGETGGPKELQAVLVSARTYDHSSEVVERLGYVDPDEGRVGRHVWFTWAVDNKHLAQCMAPALVYECIEYKGVTTVRAFVEACYGLNNKGIYDLFEYGIPDALRDEILGFAVEGTITPEPARSAFWTLGFMYGVDSLFNY
jgi:hypothetical protein